MRFPNMNFHTHTTYCDGKETAEQMVQAAIAKGFTRLGFRGTGSMISVRRIRSLVHASGGCAEISGGGARPCGKV